MGGLLNEDIEHQIAPTLILCPLYLADTSCCLVTYVLDAGCANGQHRQIGSDIGGCRRDNS